jgi:hypothetical protein
MGERVRKLSDSEFWEMVRQNGGIYARTAKAIEETFNITYTRQSVKERAEKKPELLADIEDEFLDKAEGGLSDLLESTDERVKLEAVKFTLKTKGKKRGYVEKSELDIGNKDGQPFEATIRVIKPKVNDDDPAENL